MKTLRGVIEVDFSAFAVGSGYLDDGAVVLVHDVLAGIPPQSTVVVNLGCAQWFSPRFLDLLPHYLAQADHVQVTGSNARGVARVLSHLRSTLAVG